MSPNLFVFVLFDAKGAADCVNFVLIRRRRMAAHRLVTYRACTLPIGVHVPAINTGSVVKAPCPISAAGAMMVTMTKGGKHAADDH